MPTNASAKNDSVSATEDRSVTIDVTDNDSGSGVKLYSLDQTTPSHVTTSGLSALGATIKIQNGQVVYSASSDAITALAAGQHATDTFTYTIQGSSGTLSTATVTINLTGVNDAPVVVGSVTASVNEDAAVSTINALGNASDPDAGSTLSVVSLPSHLPTGVTYDAASHSFKLDPTNAIFQSLGAGDTQTVSVSYQVSDGTLKTNDTASWTVHGVNDTPTIGGVHTGTVVEGSLFQLGAAGYLTISDPDAGESHFAASTIQFGNYGAFAFDANTGVWGYLVNNAKIQFLGAGDTVTDTLTVKSADGSASQDIVININGVNDAATMTGTKTGAVTEGSTTAHVATGVLTVTDADQNQAKLAIPANLAGTYGTFAIDQATGKWTYTLDDTKAAPLKAGQTTTDTLTVKSVDGTASSQIVVTITGTDTAPSVSGAVKGTVAGNAPASLDALGNAHDSEGGSLSVVGVPTSLPAGVTYDAATHSFILDPTNPTYVALAQGETQTVTVTYGVSDGVNVSPASVSWTLTGSNDAPTVSGAVTGAATQGGLSTVNALGTASDIDHNTTLAVTGVPTTLPAGVTYDATTHSFTLNSADPSYKSLAQGETQTVTVTYAVSDGITTTPATVSWTVTGTNDAPVVSAPLTGAASQGATSTAVDALGGASDVDHNTTLAVTGVPASLPAGVTYDATTHSFSLNAADPSYAHLGAGQTQAVSVTFGVSDGITTTPQTVTWTVTGANDAPVVSAALTGAAAQGGVSTVAALTGASDVDDGTQLNVVQPATLPAGVTYDAATHSYSLNAGDPSYAHLAAGATQVVTVSYGVSDGTATTQQSISWTVTGANDAPTVSAPLAGAAADGAAPSTVNALSGAADLDDGAQLSVVNVPTTLPAGVTYDPATHSFSLDGSNSAYDHLTAGQTQAVSLTFGVSDGTAVTQQTISWTVTGANDAPVVAGALTAAAADGAAPAAVDALAGASDVDDGSHLSVVQPSTLPAGVTYDPATHSFSLDGSNSAYDHLAAGQTQAVTLTYGVSDGTATTQQSITWTVTGANDAPTVSAPLTGAAADGAAPSTVDALSGAADLDDGAQLSVVNVPTTLPAGVTYDPATHSFSLDGSNSAYDHLAAGQTQTVSLTFGVSDGTAVTQQTITWTVTGANDAPVVAGALTAAAADGAAPAGVDALAGASDVDDGSHLSVVQPSTLPAGVTYDPATHSFVLDGSNSAYDHLAAGQTQAVTLTFGVSDGTAVTQQSITWTVTGANDAPVVSTPLVAAAADGAAPSAVNALAGASDVDDGAQLSVVVPQTLPAGVTYDTATHSFVLDGSNSAYDHLAAGQTQAVSLTFGVSDGTATTAQTVTWTVTGANDAPVVAGSLAGAASQGGVSTVDALSGASDVDDGSTLSVVQPANLPAGVTYDAATHSYSLNAADPSYAHLAAGATQVVTVSYGVSDGTATTQQSISWTVTGANDAPVVAAPLTGAAAQGAVSTVAALTGASDVDDGTTLNIVQPATLPAGVTYDAATHSYSLNAADPSYAHLAAGDTQVVTVSYGVSDGAATTSQSISWTVTGANDAPVVAGALSGAAADGAAPAVVDALSGASDVDDHSTLSVVNVPAALPAGVIYDAATHSFSLDGSNSAYDHLAAGQTQAVTVTYGVSDGTATIGQSITWTVTGANDAPVVVAGAPSAATDQDSISRINLLAGASDPDDGTALSVVMPSSLPNGVTYDAVSHALTLNAPYAGYHLLHEGETRTLTVSYGVTDGTATTAQTATWTVMGYNDPAIILVEQFPGGVAEDSAALHSTSALVTVEDPDWGQDIFAVPRQVAGTYGTFSQSETEQFGTPLEQFTYTLDDSKVQSLGAGQTTTDVLHLTSLDGTASQDIVVTITGTNDIATIVGEVGQVVEDDSLYNVASGHLTITDVDTGQAKLASTATLAGAYGSFQFNADVPNHPVWIYTLDNSHAEVQALAAGETMTDTVHVTSFDGSAGYDVKVVINGANDVATISGQSTGGVTEDSAAHHTASGQLTVSDVDHGQAKFAAPSSLAGTYGAFSFNTATGAWGYTLDDSKVQALAAGETTSDVLHVTSLDGTAGQDLVVIVSGANDAATISGSATGAVTEDDAAHHATSGVLAVADIDRGETHLQAPASLAGQYGTFTLDITSGQWGYTVDDSKVQALAAGASVTDTLAVRSADGSATQPITVTIHGSNDAPTFGGASGGSVVEDDALHNVASGTLTVSDPDSGESRFATPTSLAGQHGAFTFDAPSGAWTYTLNNADRALDTLDAGQTLTDTLTVHAVDGAPHNIDVTINGANELRVINAAADQVVTLNTGGAATRWEWGLGANEFTDNKPYTLTATLADGSPLPSGLTFNTNTSQPTFGGIDGAHDRGVFLWSGATSTPASYDIKVTASDGTNSASDTFTLKTVLPQTVVNTLGGVATGGSGDDLVLGDGYALDPASGHDQISAIATATGSAYLTTPTTTISARGAATVANTNSGQHLDSPSFVGNALPSQGALSFGVGMTALGGSVIDANGGSDDAYGKIDLTPLFGPNGLNFFGQTYTSTYLNVNGLLSFTAGVSTWVPTHFPITPTVGPLIAALWGDVDTRGGASVLTANQVAAGFTNQIYYNLDTASGALTITWDGVAVYSQNTNALNTFQLQLVPLGDQGTFDVIFRYQSVNWLTGTASSTPPQVGIDAGDGVHYYDGAASQTSGILNLPLLSNTDPAMPGTQIFRIGADPTGAASLPSGSVGAEILNGGRGNDTLIGGRGNDTFLFHPGDGQDIIRDFVPGSPTYHDTVQLLGYGASLDSFAEVISHAAQVGQNVIIQLGGTDTLTLENTTLGQLISSDFAFKPFSTVGVAETFEVDAGSGASSLDGFDTGATVHDTVLIKGYGPTLDTFSELSARMSQVGADTKIALGGSDTLTLTGVSLSALTAKNFIFEAQATASSDSFELQAGGSPLIIDGFAAGNGGDRILLHVGATMDSLNEVLANATTSGTDLVIANGADRLTLHGVTSSQLTGQNFVFDEPAFANEVFSLTSGQGSFVLEGSIPGAGTGHNVIRLFGYAIHSFADLSPHIVASGQDTVIHLSATETITLQWTDHSTLVAADFAFGQIATAAADTFTFTAGMDNQAIRGFTAGASTGHDVLRLLNLGVSTSADALAHAVQSGADTVFTFAGGGVVILENTLKTALVGADFLFA